MPTGPKAAPNAAGPDWIAPQTTAPRPPNATTAGAIRVILEAVRSQAVLMNDPERLEALADRFARRVRSVTDRMAPSAVAKAPYWVRKCPKRTPEGIATCP